MKLIFYILSFQCVWGSFIQHMINLLLSIASEIWRSISHSQTCQLREVKVCYRLGVMLKLNYTVLIEVITQYNKIGNDNVICQAPKKPHATLTAHNFWSAWNFHFKFSKEEFQLISLILFQSKYLEEMAKFQKLLSSF